MFFFLSTATSAMSSPAMLGIKEHRDTLRDYQRAQSTMQFYNYQGDNSIYKKPYTGTGTMQTFERSFCVFIDFQILSNNIHCLQQTVMTTLWSSACREMSVLSPVMLRAHSRASLFSETCSGFNSVRKAVKCTGQPLVDTLQWCHCWQVQVAARRRGHRVGI